MAYSPKLEVANFNCKFGQYNMLDFADDIVLPTLLASGQRRSIRGATYLLYRTKVMDFKIGAVRYVAVAGEFIKDMYIQSSQVFDEDQGLVPNDASLHTSPSALFVLIFDPHVLLYMRKSSDAPGMESFGNTIERMCNDRREALISHILAGIEVPRNAVIPARINRANLAAAIPRADIEVVPLMPDASIVEFIKSLSKLTEVQYELFPTNNTTDFNDFFERAVHVGTDANATRTEIVHKNKDGLDKDVAASQALSVTGIGTSQIRLKGNDRHGNKVTGTSSSLRIQSPYAGERDEIDQAAHDMVQQFSGLLADGTLSGPPSDPDASARAADLYNEYYTTNDD